MSKQDHSRCSPEGRALGRELVRITAPAIVYLESQGEHDERCPTCAFREGTVPNGCAQTGMDAIKCVVEGVPFMCHHKKPYNSVPCHGWYAVRVALRGATGKMPYDFSPEDEP